MCGQKCLQSVDIKPNVLGIQYRSVLDSGVYYDLCDSYAQFAIQVTNISLLNVENEEITACGYILFADGTAVSTDAFTTSYAAQQ